LQPFTALLIKIKYCNRRSWWNRVLVGIYYWRKIIGLARSYET